MTPGTPGAKRTKRKSPLDITREIFWDVDPARLDPNRHAKQIVERVLEAGGIEDWRKIRRYYGDDRLREIVTNHRSLSQRNVALMCVALDLRKEDFRCCTAKPFPSAPWVY